MYPHVAHVFIDGAYLRKSAEERGRGLIEPAKLAASLVASGALHSWARRPSDQSNAVLARVVYYDAFPEKEDSDETSQLEAYWKAVELLPDVVLGFGELRGLRKRVRQKGVDTLIATHMVAGAYSGLFDVAILVAGDADFVPVLEEVKRRGVMAAVAAFKESLSEDLRRVADRFVELQDWPEEMKRPDGSPWKA